MSKKNVAENVGKQREISDEWLPRGALHPSPPPPALPLAPALCPGLLLGVSCCLSCLSLNSRHSLIAFTTMMTRESSSSLYTFQ